ncbi:MAG: phosphatidate cytidylyltransferase [Desulfobacteraceae bacterium]|nr:phosphatidate cytidylyltransferase [Desulfobacteraceae bacterium]
MSMHRQRWITGLILLPAVIGLIVAGGLFLALFAALVCAASLFEYLRIVGSRGPGVRLDAASWLLLLTGPAIVVTANWTEPGLVAVGLGFNLILVGILATVAYAVDRPVSVDVIARQVLGSVYLALPLALIVLMRQGQDGAAWVFWLLLMAFCGDIGAFYAGSYLGRHKLCLAVSPKKTIEGALGGLGASALIGAIFKALFLAHLPWDTTLALFLAIGITAPLGDLFESMLKRAGHIKDSGVILPGHGGMLDRIDALIFAAPVAYLFNAFIF